MRIAVGIPSYREADTIAYVARQADEGLALLADPSECLIINADGNSPDETSRVFLETPTRCRKQAMLTADHVGKGSNVFNILRYCREHHVQALALMDADVRSVTSEWAAALLGPILRGEADYVAPLYLRLRFEGASTNHFAYPLLSAWFGSRIRQPIGGEFGFSAGLIDYLLQQPVNREIYGYGIDIFMSMHAAGGGFGIVQAQLGRKQHKPSFPKTPRIFPEMATAAISVARRYRMSDGGDGQTASDPAIDEAREQLNAEESRTALAEALARIKELMPVYESWFDGSPIQMTQLAAELTADEPRLSAEVWAELAAACTERGVRAAHEEEIRSLADQLFPLWRVRMISFSRDNFHRSAQEVEAEIEHQRRLFSESLRRRV